MNNLLIIITSRDVRLDGNYVEVAASCFNESVQASALPLFVDLAHSSSSIYYLLLMYHSRQQTK